MKTNDIRQKNESSPARRADPADVESIDAIVMAAYDGTEFQARPERSAIGIASALCIFQVLVLFQPR